MKKGLVMEGGGYKGLFTCGVLDVFLEHGVAFDGAVGVSAGAAFGCNFKSKQIGRPLRYNKKYAKDPRYASWRNFLKTGNLFETNFCYEQIPWVLDPWDQETYRNNPMEFTVVATELTTGKAVYHKVINGDRHDVEWFRASSSIPIVSTPVEVDGYCLLDGGVGDPLPLKYFQECGYERNVMITTKPKEYRRAKRAAVLKFQKFWYRKYPAFAEALGTYPDRYNKEMEYIAEEEEQGRVLVIRPTEKLTPKTTNNDPEYLEYMYQMGRKEGVRRLPEVIEYLGKE